MRILSDLENLCVNVSRALRIPIHVGYFCDAVPNAPGFVYVSDESIIPLYVTKEEGDAELYRGTVSECFGFLSGFLWAVNNYEELRKGSEVVSYWTPGTPGGFIDGRFQGKDVFSKKYTPYTEEV